MLDNLLKFSIVVLDLLFIEGSHVLIKIALTIMIQLQDSIIASSDYGMLKSTSSIILLIFRGNLQNVRESYEAFRGLIDSKVFCLSRSRRKVHRIYRSI